MVCNSILIFPEVSPTLPCANHGLLMVDWSEVPLRKKLYRALKTKKFQQVTYKEDK